MTAEAILAAREAGQLDDLLAGRDQIESADTEIKPPEPPQPQLAEEPPPRATVQPGVDRPVDVVSREQLYAMSPTEIMQAYEDGRLDRLKPGNARDA